MCEVTNEKLGLTNEIALRHTILAFYIALQPNDTKLNAIDSMAGPNVASLKYTLGILTSRFRANHPLKSCQLCRDNDLQSHGVSYWHLSHQYPSSTICMKHELILDVEYSKSDGTKRFEWLLPDQIKRFEPVIDSTSISDHQLRVLSRLTSFGLDFVRDAATIEIDNKRAQRVIAREIGLARDGLEKLESASIKDQFARAMTKHIGFANKIPGFHGFSETRNQASQVLAIIGRKSPRPTHPMRILLLVEMLWRDWSSFVQSYNTFNDPTRNIKQPEQQPYRTDEVVTREALIEALERGNTVSCAARTLNISTATAQIIAARNGIGINRRPKRLTLDKQELLIRHATLGCSKFQLAEICDVSAQTVIRFLKTENDLYERWQYALFMRTRTARREVWSSLFDNDLASNIKDARASESAVYAWLYRNDRVWLIAQNQARSKTPSKQEATVDWQRRDIQLAKRVSESLEAIVQDGNRAELTLGRLCEAVPELRAKVRKLSRLPKTHRILYTARLIRDGQSVDNNLDTARLR